MMLALYTLLHASLTALHLQDFCASVDMLRVVVLLISLLSGTHYAAAQDGYADKRRRYWWRWRYYYHGVVLSCLQDGYLGA